jgi:hypothetical protein
MNLGSLKKSEPAPGRAGPAPAPTGAIKSMRGDYPMKGTSRARSEFAKGQMVQMKTTFDGTEAPGGNYYPETRHYVKACRNSNAGRHPHRPVFGGIDSEIFSELKRSRCQTIELRLPGQTPMYATFEDLLEEGFSVFWKDPRFSGPRRYLDQRFWYRKPSDVRSRLSKLQERRRMGSGEGRQLTILDAISAAG